MTKAILTDVTRCIGCEQCVSACVEENGLQRDVRYRWTNSDGLSGERFTSVIRHRSAWVRKQCRHCQAPACASACPVGALHQTPEGPVVYDSSKCLGCRYCMMACPFGIPRYSWDSAVPYVRKCTMCQATRVSRGEQPACTEHCPVQATVFGERDELLQEAHRRLAAEPRRYHQEVAGERVVGGTNVLYVAPFSLDFLRVGLPLDDRPLPDRTAPAMAAVPPVFVGMGALLSGLYWVIDRRMQRQGEQGEPKAGATVADQAAGTDDTTEE